MSKRYGRNQKRQHRERIADLERQLAAAKAKADRAITGLETLKREVEAWDDEIHRLLGAHSALRKDTPQLEARDPIMAMAVRHPTPTRFSEFGGVTTEDMAQSHENMHRYMVQIISDQMRLTRLIRLVETNGSGGMAAYCLSDHLVKHHGFGEGDMHVIATEIAHQLTQLRYYGAKTTSGLSGRYHFPRGSE